MTDLDQLGRKHRRLQDELEAVREELAPVIREERAAGATLAELMTRSGYKTIETIRQIVNPNKRAEINQRRVQRHADGASSDEARE